MANPLNKCMGKFTHTLMKDRFRVEKYFLISLKRSIYEKIGQVFSNKKSFRRKTPYQFHYLVDKITPLLVLKIKQLKII